MESSILSDKERQEAIFEIVLLLFKANPNKKPVLIKIQKTV